MARKLNGDLCRHARNTVPDRRTPSRAPGAYWRKLAAWVLAATARAGHLVAVREMDVDVTRSKLGLAAILPLRDWTRDSESVASDPGLYEEIRAVRRTLSR